MFSGIFMRLYPAHRLFDSFLIIFLIIFFIFIATELSNMSNYSMSELLR